MSSSPATGRRSAGDKKTPPTSIVTRNGARKAKIQTRAMSANAKPSAAVVAIKKKAQQKKRQQADVLVRDYNQIAMESKFKVKGHTGFVTELRMAEHRCLWDEKYPENPQRLISVIDRCKELDLISQCKQFPPRAATQEELSSLHSPSVYELMKTTHQNQDIAYLEEVSSRYDAIYIHPSTHEMALIAAGSTIEMVDRILSGVLQNGFAAVRPPGHHAMRSEPCGYCFYNNAALAAQHALDIHGVNRILIVDWDVHHGQATQQMFYDDPRVVYFSIHRYEHGAFWPNLKQSNFHYTGTGAGTGYTFNVPLNKVGMKDADYLAIWHQLLLPMAFEFSPQLILVSAGYDSALGDEKGEMEVTPACYPVLLQLLMSVCPAVCVVLEGGYCLPSLAEGAALTLRTLLGHPPPMLEEVGEPSDSVRETILNCIYAHKKQWRCYSFQPTYSVDESVPNVCDVRKEKHRVLVTWLGDETVPDRYETRDCYPVQSEHFIRGVMERLDHLKKVTDLSIAKNAVCYIYDEAMLKHRNICEPGHVECPDRIQRIHELHHDFDLMSRVKVLTARRATVEELQAVHTEQYLKRLTELATTKLRELNNQKEKYDSVYFHPDSLESASVAAGCVLQMVDAVMEGTGAAGVCAVRPPGHHASADTPSGFCLLNNAAIAARYALARHRLDRVLVLDWDVHHGNGTQKITYDSRQILYISIHRYDNGSFFPNSKEGDYTAVGKGDGEGFNMNIPWNKRGMGDAEYVAAMTRAVLPVAHEYRPQLVLVSAGFDACAGDPLGGCKVTPECYAQMTQMLRSLAGGRVILVLEGGYNVNSISCAMTMCTKALLGDPITPYYDPKVICHPSAIESINNVISVHKKYWTSLKFQVALPIENVIEKPGPSRGLVIYDATNDSENSNDSNSGVDAVEREMARLSIVESRGEASNVSGSDAAVVGSRSTEKKSDLAVAGPSTMGESSVDEDTNVVVAGHSTTGKRSVVKDVDLAVVGPSSAGEISVEKDVDLAVARPSTTAESSMEKASDSAEAAGTSSGAESNSVRADLSLERPGPSSSSGNREYLARPSTSAGLARPKAADIFSERNCPRDPESLFHYLSQNMGYFIRGEMYAVVPEPWCPHLDDLPSIPDGEEFVQGSRCVDCKRRIENWVCLQCYGVYCSRYANKHLQRHFEATGHPLSLSLSDLSVWCSECQLYLDNERLYDACNNAHRNKFGEDMPRSPASTVQME